MKLGGRMGNRAEKTPLNSHFFVVEPDKGADPGNQIQGVCWALKFQQRVIVLSKVCVPSIPSNTLCLTLSHLRVVDTEPLDQSQTLTGLSILEYKKEYVRE